MIPWFTVGPWEVRLPWSDAEVLVAPFEVTVILALLIGIVVAKRFARIQDRSVSLTMDLALYLILFSFPASWVLNGLLYEPAALKYLLSHPSEILQVRLGWSLYGGIAGCIPGAWIWKWRTGASILRVGDAAAFGAPFGWAVARTGCFITHDHPGIVSTFPLTVADYQVGIMPYEARHDLGLYEALAFAAIAALFLGFSRKLRPDGFYVTALALLYTPLRFFLDFLRAPPSEGGDIRYWGLTPGQYASVVLFTVGVFLFRNIRGSTRRIVASER